MADTEGMVRIIRHAADRLEQEDPSKLASNTLTTNERNYLTPRVLSLTVALTYAAAVLRMVAACMNTGSEQAQPDLWREGYEAGCSMSHSLGCDAVAGERDQLREEVALLRAALPAREAGDG